MADNTTDESVTNVTNVHDQKSFKNDFCTVPCTDESVTISGDIITIKGSSVFLDGTRFKGDICVTKTDYDSRFLDRGYTYNELLSRAYENDGTSYGCGVFSHLNSNVYIGDFVSKKYNGHGLLILAVGGRYKGKFVNGHYNGNGIHNPKDGVEYKGGFVDGLYWGKGTYHFDGNSYTGDFKKFLDNLKPEDRKVY